MDNLNLDLLKQVTIELDTECQPFKRYEFTLGEFKTKVSTKELVFKIKVEGLCLCVKRNINLGIAWDQGIKYLTTFNDLKIELIGIN